MKAKNLLPPIFEIIYNKLTTSEETKFVIGKYQLQMPKTSLAKFQRTYPLYDRFLPVLAKYLPGKGTIIDVGANIGATTIALIQKCQNSFICAEPSDLYGPFLHTNINNLAPEDKARISIVKKLVGTGNIKGTLDHGKGTATLKVTTLQADPNSATLDSIADGINNLELVKVDTDGFDFDVLLSGSETIGRLEPILFWENEISEDFQYEGFRTLYNMLEAKGYRYIYIFDNYGNLITEENNFNTLQHINTYVYSMKKFQSTRTFYYTDILAATEKNRMVVEKAIADYRQNWILNHTPKN
jgi:FkbM family methyltransferase